MKRRDDAAGREPERAEGSPGDGRGTSAANGAAESAPAKDREEPRRERADPSEVSIAIEIVEESADTATAPERPEGESGAAAPAAPGRKEAAGGPGGGEKAAEAERAPEAGPAGALERAEQEIASLREERSRLYERWLRAQADYDNVRKRSEREREENRLSAIEALFREVVKVLDNFDRALASLPPDAPKGFTDGVALIHRQLLEVLSRWGLVPMETARGRFDPHVHEAVLTEVRTDRPAHQVLDERQKGYMFCGRVFRPASVTVSVRPEGEEPQPEDGEEGAGEDLS